MAPIKSYKLFFSEKLPYRIGRHGMFWIARFLLMGLFAATYSIVLQLVDPGLDVKYSWIKTSRPAILGVLIDMIYCYAVTYWLIPRCLPGKKYGRFILLLLSMTIFTFVADTAVLFYSFGWFNLPLANLKTAIWYQASSFVNSGPHVVCIFFIGVKMLKDWNKEQQKKITIARENAMAELQLLKAQMHPHFLFNTLNNIYSFTLTKDPNAANLVTRLSGLIDYMNAEGEQDYVPIAKEIQLIRDYISLEKVRYGDRLNLRIEIVDDFQNKWIAPLLMLPFVENAFKHGASLLRSSQWIKIKIGVNNNQLLFDLSNNKPSTAPTGNGKKGIGLMNVQKRLQLIYPGRHFLQIESTDDVYSVHMEITLEDIPKETEASLQQTQIFSYA